MSVQVDVAVVGAGSAGLAAAYQLARLGLRVVVFEAHPTMGGARWVNGVPPWMFERAGLALPTAPELRGGADGSAFVLADASGRHRVDLRPSPVWQVDMRALVARLAGLAQNAGATLRVGQRVRDLEVRDGRLRALRDAAGERIEAELFVDAAGVSGVLRDVVPALSRHAPAPRRDELCSAAQETFAIADKAGARAFLERFRLQPGDAFSRVGVAGGYSTLMVQVSSDLDHVEVLTGALAAPGLPSGRAILDAFVADAGWIGARIFGGAGVIPLRRAYDLLGAGGVAVIGDAACQVFPAHGSGVGPGLVAAHHLAAAVTVGAGPGADATLWDYTRRYQRDIGAVAAAYDVFRRTTAAMSAADQAIVIASGLLTENAARAGLDQRLPLTDLATTLQMARGSLRSPRLALRLGPAAARMQATAMAVRRFPMNPAPGALERWSATVRRIAGT